MRRFVFVLLLFFSFSTSAQPGIEMGSWGNELPYNKVIDLVVRPDEVVVAAENGVFYYGREFRTVDRISKIDGLSGVVITAMAEHEPTGTLIIVYENQIIDLLQGDQQSTLLDLQRFNIIGEKKVNDILIVGDRVFMSCDFGIVEMDFDSKEFDGPYFIGPNGTQVKVYEMTSDGQTLYAATEIGLFSADINDPNLRDFNAWTKDGFLQGPLNTVTLFQGAVYINKKDFATGTDTVYTNAHGGWSTVHELDYWRRNALVGNDDHLMMCADFRFSAYDSNLNLVANIQQGERDYPFNVTTVVEGNPSFSEFFLGTMEAGLVRHWNGFLAPNYLPNGPQTKAAFDVIARDNTVWTAAGGLDGSFQPLFTARPIQLKVGGKWIPSDRSIQDSVTDVIELSFDPNNPDNVWGASYGYGLLLWDAQGNLKDRFDYSNTILQERAGGPGFTNIGGIDFDNEGRLWMTNPNTSDPLAVRTRNNEWFSYTLGGLAPSTLPIKSVMADDVGQIWVQLRNDGIVVFNHGNTLGNTNDDQVKKLSTASGQGALSSKTVLSMATDKNGAVWVGTNQGVVTFFSPSRIFSGQNFDAQHVLIEQNGVLSKLLENEAVTCIAVDGANRKWFGTARSGVYLMSADGTEEVLHFTVDNSPLFSNTIQSITVNSEHGEVYIATENGLITYRSGATEGNDTFGDVYAFPNPVRPDFTGDIAIKGLAENANVKITDISGNLVFETTALGGQALWNSRSFSGQDVATGVYLVFMTNDDGSETAITKIMIIR